MALPNLQIWSLEKQGAVHGTMMVSDCVLWNVYHSICMVLYGTCPKTCHFFVLGHRNSIWTKGSVFKRKYLVLSLISWKKKRLRVERMDSYYNFDAKNWSYRMNKYCEWLIVDDSLSCYFPIHPVSCLFVCVYFWTLYQLPHLYLSLATESFGLSFDTQTRTC